MDIFQILGLVTGIVGAVGVVGLIALMIVAPPLAQVAIKIVLTVVTRILSTRIGLASTVGALCLFAGAFWGDHTGRAHEREKCEAAQARAEEGAKKRDREQTTAAANDETALARELDTDQPKPQETADAPATGADCPLVSDDVRRRQPAKRLRAR